MLPLGSYHFFTLTDGRRRREMVLVLDRTFPDHLDRAAGVLWHIARWPFGRKSFLSLTHALTGGAS